MLTNCNNDFNDEYVYSSNNTANLTNKQVMKLEDCSQPSSLRYSNNHLRNYNASLYDVNSRSKKFLNDMLFFYFFGFKIKQIKKNVCFKIF